MPVMTLEIRRVRISMQVLPMSAITSLPATLTSDWPSDCFAPSIDQRYRMALYRLCGKSIEMIRLRASRNALFVAFGPPLNKAVDSDLIRFAVGTYSQDVRRPARFRGAKES